MMTVGEAIRRIYEHASRHGGEMPASVFMTQSEFDEFEDEARGMVYPTPPESSRGLPFQLLGIYCYPWRGTPSDDDTALFIGGE